MDKEEKQTVMQPAETGSSGQAQDTSQQQAESSQSPAPSSIKVQNVRPGEKLENPNATIIVTGTVAGSVHGRIVKIWRAQQATIQAEESIFIAKEVIGSTDILNAGGKTATGGFTSVTAPEVTIGIPGQQAYLAKELEITTDRLTMYQVSIHNPVTVNLGPAAFQRKKDIEGEPARLKNRLATFAPQLHADIEDFARRIARPGNEQLNPVLNEFVLFQKNILGNKVKVFALLRKLVSELGIRTAGEVLQRWRERIDVETELRGKMAELEKLTAQLAGMTIDLSIVEMKKEASLLIRFGDSEHRLQGPLSQTAVTVRQTLVDDPSTGTKRGELSVDQQPLG